MGEKNKFKKKGGEAGTNIIGDIKMKRPLYGEEKKGKPKSGKSW